MTRLFPTVATMTRDVKMAIQAVRCDIGIETGAKLSRISNVELIRLSAFSAA